MLKESSITISYVLGMKCFEKSKIIAGHGGLKNIITSVNVMADPDVLNWVKEGELLLTTAYSFKKDDIPSQRRFFEEAKSKKLAGMGIKIHPYIDGLSPEIIDLANSLDFPLIELYYDTAFAEIITPIFMEIFNKQTALLQKVERIHNDLMAVVLRGGNLKNIIKILKKTVQNPIIIRDHYFDQYIYHKDHEENFEYPPLVEKTSIFFDCHEEHKKIDVTTERTDLWGEKNVKKIITPIIVKGNVFGHILAWELNRPLWNIDKLALESASTIIALEFLRKIAVYEVEHRYKVEFFENLITHDKKRKNDAINRANIYKLEDNAYYAVMNIFIKPPVKDEKDHEVFVESKNRMVFSLEKLFSKDKSRSLVVNREDRISILIMWPTEKEGQLKIRGLGEKIHTLAMEYFEEQKILIGIGRIYEGLHRVYKSAQDADQTMEAANLMGRRNCIVFDDLGIYKIFCQENLSEELTRFYHEILAELVEYDQRKNTELVKTLEIFFETNGNLKKMSERLFTHYNTILYRIQRIKEITGKDTDNPEDRFNLETALKIMKLVKS